MMYEIWRNIKGYESRYQISNLGRVKSLPNKRYPNENILKNSVVNNKPRVWLSYSEYCNKSNEVRHKNKTFRVSKLVAIHFIDGYSDCMNKELKFKYVDNNTLNCSVDNLIPYIDIYGEFNHISQTDKDRINKAFFRTELRYNEKYVDNYTSTLSDELNINKKLIDDYLSYMLDEKMERIDKEVNERYNQRIKSEKSKELENEMLKEFTQNFKDS